MNAESLVTQWVPFAGTQEERIANRGTHSWTYLSEGEIACSACDAKTWDVRAQYPCGDDVPSESVPRSELEGPGRGFPALLEDLATLAEATMEGEEER